MRARDRHFVLAECVLTFLALASCALAVFVAAFTDRRSRLRVSAVEERMAVAERTVTDAAAAALSACDAMRSSPSSGDSEPDASRPIRVLGYGQGRTSKRIYVYRDLELADGTSRREYVAWLPLRSEGGLQSLPPERAPSKQ